MARRDHKKENTKSEKVVHISGSRGRIAKAKVHRRKLNEQIRITAFLKAFQAYEAERFEASLKMRDGGLFVMNRAEVQMIISRSENQDAYCVQLVQDGFVMHSLICTDRNISGPLREVVGYLGFTPDWAQIEIGSPWSVYVRTNGNWREMRNEEIIAKTYKPVRVARQS